MKNKIIAIKISDEELKEIDIAAKLLSTTRSQFIRNSAIQKAREQISNEEEKGIIDREAIKKIREKLFE